MSRFKKAGIFLLGYVCSNLAWAYTLRKKYPETWNDFIDLKK